MKRKHLFILIGLSLAIIAVAVGYGIYRRSTKTQEGEILYMHPTDRGGYYEEEIQHADPLIVGKWQNTHNAGWYKVYYDDLDEDTQMFWGKEWNEAEDVHEDDLKYHGNGWFRWEKKGKALHEYATMDARDVPIHKEYTIHLSSSDSLVYYEKAYKQNFFRFAHPQ